MSEVQLIEVSTISQKLRTCFYPSAFGGAFILGENQILNFMRINSKNYDGGYWEFYSCSNGAYFATPPNDYYNLSLPNYFNETVSSKVAGIVAMFYALSNLSFVAEEKGFQNLKEHLVRNYNLLSQYVNTLNDEEYSQIKRACD
ncbi:antirestriction protein [Salmonella enterica]|nr:antirestriction protein [Salmonella enterica]EEP3373017.1 antirestriction protein [Salmonella enterica]EFP6579724.1 antirestriction protein [Salmonella enterica]EGC7971007.1 antirestriction protein [Salmonella enterica]EIV4461184.1 antirestriction protein [Salmonella enterica]